jgi:hypothetical protein
VVYVGVQVGSKKEPKDDPTSNVPKSLMTNDQLAKKRDELLVRVVVTCSRNHTADIDGQDLTPRLLLQVPTSHCKASHVDC